MRFHNLYHTLHIKMHLLLLIIHISLQPILRILHLILEKKFQEFILQKFKKFIQAHLFQNLDLSSPTNIALFILSKNSGY